MTGVRIVFGTLSTFVKRRIQENPRSNFYDVGTMLIAGVIGWLMGKVKIPTSPAILGLILGPMAEKNFRTALLKSSGNVGVFFNTPICWFFLALIAVTLFGAIRGQLKKKTN